MVRPAAVQGDEAALPAGGGAGFPLLLTSPDLCKNKIGSNELDD